MNIRTSLAALTLCLASTVAMAATAPVATPKPAATQSAKAKPAPAHATTCKKGKTLENGKCVAEKTTK